MRITQAGIRSGYPITRFAAPPATSREAHLGLRRRLGPQISSAPLQQARVPLIATLRAAARGQSVGGGVRPEETQAPSRRAVILRRSDSFTWARPAESTVHHPRSRSAAPWRG
jgi:hypothetical protein